MDDRKKQTSKPRQISSKAPPQIVNFFTKPLSPNNEQSPPSPSNDRKRKLSDKESSSRNESHSKYAEALQKDAEKISKIKSTKKAGTLVSAFFQNGNSDDLSDFESPSKRIQFKAPAPFPKKKVARKRKQPAKQTKIKNALETKIFEKVLAHHSNSDGLNSDDLQLALALSRSLADTHDSVSTSAGESEPSNISNVIRNAEPHRREDIVRKTFQLFGFKKRDNNDYDYRDFFTNFGSNKKRILKFTPLTRRNEKRQKEKFTQKVKNILQICETVGSGDSETMGEYSVTSAYLQQFFCCNSPSYYVSLALTEKTIEEFYVNNLVPISTLRCGSMLKNWADIPGREPSPVRNTNISEDTKESSSVDNESAEEVICDNSEFVNANQTTEASASHPTNESGECHLPDSIDDVSGGNTDNKVRNVREPSPDMFADYESSANNSLVDDVVLDDVIDPKDPISVDSFHIPKELNSTLGSTDNLDSENQLIYESDTKDENESIAKSSLSDDHSQCKEEAVILLSSDGSNDACEKLTQTPNSTYQQNLVNIPLITSFAKRLSFTERLQLYNSDPALQFTEVEPVSSPMDQLSQDSIVISDDEINYSIKNDDDEPSLKSIQTINANSQESIELSDSEDDRNEIASLLPETVSVENYFVNENSQDINIDDEMFNSNHSSNDEDLVNLSIQKMCQKEFVSGSVNPSSTTKSFQRTTSDISFERNCWKPIKTSENFTGLSDDEMDEFDKLVRNNRSQYQMLPENSSDDEIDKLVKSRQDLSFSDVTVSPILPQTQSNEFIVQSMDQIYEVKTGVLVSPKPDFETMDSPTRLQHLKTYGLKTLPKRKAVICLEHIYNRLHPFVELDEDDDIDNILNQKEVHVIQPDKRIDDICEPCKPLANSRFDVLQEKEDVFYLPSVPRAKRPWCLEPLHVAWYNLINSNATLHEALLQYKPLDIMEIRSLFKSIDLRFEPNDLISFLDRKCITFKTDSKRNAAVTKN